MLSSRGPSNPNEGQDVRGEVHNPQQAPPPSWKVDVFEQNTAASSAYEVHGASETYLGQHKPPEPGTHRMRDDEILQTLKVPPLEAQLAVDKAVAGSSNRDIAASAVHGGLFCWNGVAGGIGASIGVSGRGHEGQACESSPTACFATHLGGVLEQMA